MFSRPAEILRILDLQSLVRSWLQSEHSNAGRGMPVYDPILTKRRWAYWNLHASRKDALYKPGQLAYLTWLRAKFM